jgi:SAM-dependent methyltransferase
MHESRTSVTNAWRAYWQAHGEEIGGEAPEYLAQTVLAELRPAPGMRIVEAGSGTGGLSRRLAAEGAEVVLLDIIPSCIHSMWATHRGSSKLWGVVGDLFRLPLPDASCDAVFNSGVMEHFEEAEIRRGLTEMARVLKPGGTLLCIVPSARGRFYVRGKRRLELQGRWEYGTEHPQLSLARMAADAELELEREYLVGVRWQARFLDGWRGQLARAVTAPFGEHSRIGSALFGGYLLVSSWRKSGERA